MNIEDYMKGKKFYTYGESSEVFVAESKDQLYKEYFNEDHDDLEDYPSEEITLNLKDPLVVEDRLTENDVKIAEGLYRSTIGDLIEVASENKWETPWQLSSSYT